MIFIQFNAQQKFVFFLSIVKEGFVSQKVVLGYLAIFVSLTYTLRHKMLLLDQEITFADVFIIHSKSFKNL